MYLNFTSQGHRSRIGIGLEEWKVIVTSACFNSEFPLGTRNQSVPVAFDNPSVEDVWRSIFQKHPILAPLPPLIGRWTSPFPWWWAKVGIKFSLLTCESLCPDTQWQLLHSRYEPSEADFLIFGHVPSLWGSGEAHAYCFWPPSWKKVEALLVHGTL